MNNPLDQLKIFLAGYLEEAATAATVFGLNFSRQTIIMRDPDDEENYIIVTNETEDDLSKAFQFYIDDETRKKDKLSRTGENVPLDWDAAFLHFDGARKIYQALAGTPGVNTALALEHIFRPLAERYERGERTPELYREMMSVE